jgi:hypothetical protein
MRNVAEDHPDITPQQLERIRARMDQAFPDALVRGYESLIPEMVQVHAQDRHVAASAVHSGASHLVTWNTRDFPRSALSRHNVLVATPDDFLNELLDAYDPVVSDTLERHRKLLVNPTKTRREYKAELVAHGLVKAAGRLR